jgi:hypothetical protein
MILILGPADSDLEKQLSKSNSTPDDLSNVASKILEEYKSINLIDENDLYTENINMVINLFYNECNKFFLVFLYGKCENTAKQCEC